MVRMDLQDLLEVLDRTELRVSPEHLVRWVLVDQMVYLDHKDH